MSSDLVKRLRDEAAVQMDLAHDCDCPPECTSNWDAAKTLREAADRIEALEGEVGRLEAQLDWVKSAHTITDLNHHAQIRRAEAAEARAERLRVALTKAHNDLDISPLTDKERQAVVDEISAAIEEDDKQ